MNMRYDFDSPVDRRASGSYKWDDNPGDPDDMIQLWVADMDSARSGCNGRAPQSRGARSVRLHICA